MPSAGIGRRSASHGDGHLHVEITVRDHPGEQFQGVGRARVGRRQRPFSQVTFDPVPELLALLDGFDLVRRERAPDDETHVAAVADQPLDATGGQRERPGVEVAGQPVVAFRVFERRHVEQPDQIAVVRCVLPPPVAVGEHDSGIVRLDAGPSSTSGRPSRTGCRRGSTRRRIHRERGRLQPSTVHHTGADKAEAVRGRGAEAEGSPGSTRASSAQGGRIQWRAGTRSRQRDEYSRRGATAA